MKLIDLGLVTRETKVVYIDSDSFDGASRHRCVPASKNINVRCTDSTNATELCSSDASPAC